MRNQLFVGLSYFAVSVGIFAAEKPVFNRESLSIPADKKVTVTLKDYPGLTNPNPRGWYYKCANIVLAHDGSLVACFQISDNHLSLTSHIMVARSTDGGRTWGDYQAISHANVWEHQAAWVVPQMSVLRDGRLVIICDRGQRNPGQDWPMLIQWQKPNRGMTNHLFWSGDNGKTWTGPTKIDDVGGEPSYLLEMSNGVLAYTRTESASTKVLKKPPMPWGNNYYKNVMVLSRDSGKSWNESVVLTDDPFHSDCEVGLAELEPGHLIAVTRVGYGNGRYGQPSRLVYSEDYGQTWGKPIMAPFYGQRPHVGKLKSGKLLVTYRNVWGTPGTRALVFDPKERLSFQPASWILDEDRCELTAEKMVLRTSERQEGAVEFSFYPAQDDESLVEIEATMRLDRADENGCAISAGAWVRFLPGRVCLADNPAMGFDLDTRLWHAYRIVRAKGEIAIFVDGKKMLSERLGVLWVHRVRIGNRGVSRDGDPYSRNAAVSEWRTLAVKVVNKDTYSIDWKWKPADGYPDQFRRDREVILDYANSSDCGYSSWTELPDGKIVIVNYTTTGLEDFSSGGNVDSPFVRAYLVSEKDLTR
jgi:hypothetical protein